MVQIIISNFCPRSNDKKTTNIGNMLLIFPFTTLESMVNNRCSIHVICVLRLHNGETFLNNCRFWNLCTQYIYVYLYFQSTGYEEKTKLKTKIWALGVYISFLRKDFGGGVLGNTQVDNNIFLQGWRKRGGVSDATDVIVRGFCMFVFNYLGK